MYKGKFCTGRVSDPRSSLDPIFRCSNDGGSSFFPMESSFAQKLEQLALQLATLCLQLTLLNMNPFPSLLKRVEKSNPFVVAVVTILMMTIN